MAKVKYYAKENSSIGTASTSIVTFSALRNSGSKFFTLNELNEFSPISLHVAKDM